LELLRRRGAEILSISYWFGRVQCQNYVAERSVQHVADNARFFRQRNRNVEARIYDGYSVFASAMWSPEILPAPQDICDLLAMAESLALGFLLRKR